MPFRKVGVSIDTHLACFGAKVFPIGNIQHVTVMEDRQPTAWLLWTFSSASLLLAGAVALPDSLLAAALLLIAGGLLGTFAW